jgi:hypothetical protein
MSMQNARARVATSLPIRPTPTMPSVRSFNSLPSSFERSHFPSRIEAVA